MSDRQQEQSGDQRYKLLFSPVVWIHVLVWSIAVYITVMMV